MLSKSVVTAVGVVGVAALGFWLQNAGFSQELLLFLWVTCAIIVGFYSVRRQTTKWGQRNLVMGMGVSNYVTSMLPGGWHPTQYWAAFGTLLFGTAFLVGLVFRAVRGAYDLVAPRSLLVIAQSGHMKASIQLTHSGEPTTYEVFGCIESSVSGGMNPAPQTFHAEIQPGAGKNGEFKVTLSDGDFAHIIVGEMRYAEGPLGRGVGYFYARRGKYNSVVQIADSGVVMAYSIRTSKRTAGAYSRRFTVSRKKGNEFIDISEMGEETNGTTNK